MRTLIFITVPPTVALVAILPLVATVSAAIIHSAIITVTVAVTGQAEAAQAAVATITAMALTGRTAHMAAIIVPVAAIARSPQAAGTAVAANIATTISRWVKNLAVRTKQERAQAGISTMHTNALSPAITVMVVLAAVNHLIPAAPMHSVAVV